ncbi:ABC-type antimicrobial peptide transport system permease subunit [Pontibacter aydingkolensis]|uniref:ABC transporter permease n=1 Tax=Pontibacter aydingkolensis TaxID=1911536 RepID=A0ABS7CXA2_9BACT|nr:ABC transporter permease [Pontibacter aydingkolensis]MBW7468469.1 ABC transporter permease [Pontibacter aydingkolensis]
MFKMYFLTASRSILRNKSYSILNIAGLTLGITCSILLFLVIKYELSYDSFHSKADRIYRATTISSYREGEEKSSAAHYPLADLLRTNKNLGFEQITQTHGEEGGQINVLGDDGNSIKRFREEAHIGFVEPEFFDIFDFETGNQSAVASLSEPNNVILTETLATKYFDGKNPLGRLIKFNNKLTLKVTGVIPDLPNNTDLPFSMFISYKSFIDYSPYGDAKSWNTLSSTHQLYAVLPESKTEKEATAELNNLLVNHIPDKSANLPKEAYSLQPLKDIHFNAELSNYSNRTVSREVIWSMALVGIFMVIVACINFVNLATAQAIKRAREVGVRKVMGSSQLQLMLQFLGETFLITLTATLLSVVLAELALPYLNELLELEITFTVLQDPVLLFFLVAQVLLVTLFAGIYPALIMARFQPIAALKSRINTQKVAGLSLRSALVVLQFTICQVLIICTILVNEQMEFFKSKSLGFDKEAVVTVFLPTGEGKKLMPMRQELANHPAVKKISLASSPPSANFTFTGNFKFNNSSEDVPFHANYKMADENYLELYDMKVLAGRHYKDSDSAAYVINETMRRKLGIESPAEAINKTIALGNGEVKGYIIGVVEDFHQNSLRDPIDPAIILARPDNYWFLSAKIDMANKQEALQHLEKVWNKTYPDDVFDYEFLDETIERFYQDEARQNKLFKIFSIIAIFIGCLGLYGLVAFMAAQRTKEVGIRKVLGASMFNITVLFSKEFVKLVLIAFILAVPIAYYLMNKWLQDFTYRITLDYWPFILAGVVTLIIAIITMSSQAIKASLTNPVVSLKSE